MPIQDWNGTAASEVKTLQDWDGTAGHQIGKVYDWDGTANHLIYSGETVLTNLSGWAASSGSPESTGSHWREVTSDGSWNLSGVSTIQSISGTTGTPLEYWAGGAYVDGAKYIYLVFSDGTTKEIARWSFSKNYWAADANTAWSASNIDISSYTDAQKKTVKLKYRVNVYVRDTYGSYWTELTFSTSSVIVS